MAASGQQRAAIDRLWWRAGFGARPADLDRLERRGLDAAVDELLAPPAGPSLDGTPAARVEGHALDPANSWGHDSLWWLDRAVRARHPLVERMTLNWHDHLAVSNDKVGNVRLMLAYYRTLRRQGLGRFRDLARAVVQDGAMQLFLDLANSDRSAPNENFAREFFELFTLGAGNGYTERDVRESARALTGFTFEWDHKRFGYDAKRHDPGVKRILGHRGRFEPLDVVDLALANRHHAPFLCQKLWSYFTPEPCPPAALREMTRAYQASGTQIRPVLRIILRHPALYADLDEPGQVKPPVVYAAGMLRRTHVRITGGEWVWLLDTMGQRPFYPPNVGGWDQDLAWLSTATIRARFNAASTVMHDLVAEGSVPASRTPEQAVAEALRASGSPWVSRTTQAGLLQYARRSVAGRTQAWQVKHYFPERQRVLLHLLLAGPDAQVS